MTMDGLLRTDNALATAAPLDAKTLLRRVDHRIALLRAWISHDHHDEPYWWARGMTAARAQYDRAMLRRVADLLHVERATRRGRIHGTRFADLDAQRAWLASYEHQACGACATLAGLPRDATLAQLRDGKLAV
jgi:hypothetical protein